MLMLLVIFLRALDFTIWVLTFGPLKLFLSKLSIATLRSTPYDGGDESRRRNVRARDCLRVTAYDDVHTVYEMSKRAFELYADNRCIGTRKFLGQEGPKVKRFGDVHWRTYGEVEEESLCFGAALRKHGVEAGPQEASIEPFTTPCTVAIFENTCAEWMIAAQGAFTQSVVVTTIYATLGMDAVVDAVSECKTTAMVCNRANVRGVLDRAADMPTLKLIIYTDDLIDETTAPRVPRSTHQVKVVSFEEFLDEGDAVVEDFPPTPPAPSSTAVVMYTSGSTGKPKGVVIKHSNIVATCTGFKDHFDGAIREGEEVYLAYLPLAHILELVAELSMIGLGASLGYADPKTLSTTGARPIGAMEQFGPTLMAGVPKIWDVIKKGVEAKVAADPSPVKRALFKAAVDARKFAMKNGFDTPLFNLLVFKKVRNVVGGRLRLAISGGGPLNSDVQEFVRACFGCPLFQGYGLTETTAALTIQDHRDLRCGIAGVPITCCEIKLESTPEIMDKAGLPYLTSDRFDHAGNPVYGRGEVLAKGNNISVGYYGLPDKTAEEYGTGPGGDGYFHTGDIGQFMADGSLRIVDRKKNLVKLKGGEYIAIENMEMSYGNSIFVDAIAGGICCYGDGDMDRPVALMQLNLDHAAKWAAANGVDNTSPDVLRSNVELKKAVLEDLIAEGKKAGLSNIEKLVDVVFVESPWTPENGCLTAANKLQRRVVVETFKSEFENVRSSGIFR